MTRCKTIRITRILAFALLLPLFLAQSPVHAQIREGADTLIFDLNLIDKADSLNAEPQTEGAAADRKSDKTSRKDKIKEAGNVTFDNLHLDTVVVKKKNLINDYSMIGVQYGYGVASGQFNPSRGQRFVLAPYNFGVTYTRYGKMFNYMPFFGLQVGAYYNTEGYRFKIHKDTGEPSWLESGADKAILTSVDGTANAHCHVDFWKMKLIINIGYYIGYRLSVTRYREGAVINSEFNDYDRRFDYGVKGGAGFGFVFDPIEIHLQATFKQSFQNLYEPDYHSQYYYRYAYPYSIVVSAGIHVQITKRVGKTTRQIKQEAKEAIFQQDENGRNKNR